MKNILIIPSWYPRPDDKINGSFFQEQARLVNGHFDVKVLFFRFVSRPSIRALLKAPIRTGREWVRLIFQGKSRTRTQLPADEVFTNPPLIEYRMRTISFTRRHRHKKRLDAYLEALGELIASGWKPDLIHAHSVNMGGLVAQRIKEVYGIPYVITEHIPFALCNYPDYMRDDIKCAFRNANEVLSLGYDMVRQLAMSDIDVEPNLVFNFVNEDMFNKLCAPYRPGLPLKLISIGASSHYKDHRTLLRALVLLKARGVPFTMTLIGLKVWGGLYDETMEFISTNDLSLDVKVIDRLTRDEVPDYLAVQHVFVITSIFETFCVSIIEALASGLPVITTNHGGGSIDLIEKATGVVVPVRDYLSIADKLEDIYRGNIRFEPEAIRDHVVSICGTDAFKQRLIGYYERAMEKLA